MLHALTGAPALGTRFAMTDQLLNRLSERRRLIVVGEAQNLLCVRLRDRGAAVFQPYSGRLLGS